MQQSTICGACQPFGGGVFMQVVKLEFGGDDVRNPGLCQPVDIRPRQHVPLFQRAFGQAKGMGEQSPFSEIKRHATKAHQLPFLSAEITAPSTATAISAGEAAPMSSPIGAWMRESAASLTPAAFSLSTLVPWVLRLPSAPT